jgi:hypothetical protein
MGYSGAGGKLIDKKTRSEKSRDTVPLSEYERRTLAYTSLIVTSHLGLASFLEDSHGLHPGLFAGVLVPLQRDFTYGLIVVVR